MYYRLKNELSNQPGYHTEFIKSAFSKDIGYYVCCGTAYMICIK